MKLPKNGHLKKFATNLRKRSTLSEVLLWNKLKNKQFHNLDFDRQKPIGNYIVDFYCPTLNLVIEIDGSSHDDKDEYDSERNSYLTAFGLYVLHVKDKDVKQKIGNVLARLQSAASQIQNCTAPAADSRDWWA